MTNLPNLLCQQLFLLLLIECSIIWSEPQFPFQIEGQVSYNDVRDRLWSRWQHKKTVSWAAFSAKKLLHQRNHSNTTSFALWATFIIYGDKGRRENSARPFAGQTSDYPRARYWLTLFQSFCLQSCFENMSDVFLLTFPTDGLWRCLGEGLLTAPVRSSSPASVQRWRPRVHALSIYWRAE